MDAVGSSNWNDQMYKKHKTPYSGIAGIIEKNRISYILQYIKKYSIQKKNIIEVGCERGTLLNKIKEKFPESKLTGLDISKNALIDAKKLMGDKTTLIQADISKDFSLLEDKQFDIIVCSETLEHILNVDDALKNIFELAGPNSILIFTVPLEKYKLFLKNLIFKGIKILNFLFKDIEEGFSEWHLHNFSKKEFIDLIESHGEIKKYKSLFFHQIIICKKKPNP